MSNIKNFGAIGDGKADDTKAIQHAVNDGDGLIRLPRGKYRITKTININTTAKGPIGIDGSNGAAKIINAGPGPAFRITGSHTGTADPSSFKPVTWANERMPTITNLEIEGAHSEADGVECIQTMQATIEGLAVRNCRHGIRLYKRNRNVIISHCHLYKNSSVGIFLDAVNLHQINIVDSHISYNRLGGIRIEKSEIRNLQITGNDIEYNNHRAHKSKPEPTAEIWVDTTAPRASVREVTITSNTIQATPSPAGCNIRIFGKKDLEDLAPGMWTITGNVIGNQETGIHLTNCRGLALAGNFIYSHYTHNIRLENCRNIAIGANSFGHNYFPKGRQIATGIKIADSQNIAISGIVLQDAPAGPPDRAREKDNITPAKRRALLEIHNSNRVNITGCQFLDAVPNALYLNNASFINITGSTIVDTRTKPLMQRPIQWLGDGTANLLANNAIASGTAGSPTIADSANVTQQNNLTP